MKIILEEFSRKTPKDIIDMRIDEYSNKGKDVKSEIRGNVIILYYVDKIGE